LSPEEISSWPQTVTIYSEQKGFAVLSKDLIQLIRSSAPPHLPEILENCPVGVVVIDEESRIIFANKAYTDILGIPRPRIMGRRMRDVEPKADILSVLENGTPLINHLSHIQSVNRHVRVNIFPLCKEGRRCGAFSHFIDVTEAARLTEALDRATTLADHLRKELDDQRGLPNGFADIIGRNKEFLLALRTAGAVAVTDAPLLILGEHGAGKEVLARAVHAASPRREKPFITVNCAAIPETLLESELFGYEDGAFTGARRGGALGKFELAGGGTIFLDEIGDMPLSMQAKMLRALQEKEIEKIGRGSPVPIDVRVLAATNRNLTDMVENGRFRADLYYRLNMATVVIPPLRKRVDDIVLLAGSILDKCCRKYGKKLTMSPGLPAVLQNHNWPGNVRELANSLEYAVIMCAGSRIEAEHLPNRFPAHADRPPEDASGKAFFPADQTGQAAIAANVFPPTGNWKETIRQTEFTLVSRALAASKGNRSEAIRKLGLSRKTFYAKLKEYGFL
jgi:PAS domain S-box-containing protein